MFQLLKTLTSLHGPCGFEQPVTAWIKNKLQPIVDEVQSSSRPIR